LDANGDLYQYTYADTHSNDHLHTHPNLTKKAEEIVSLRLFILTSRLLSHRAQGYYPVFL